MFTIIGGDGKEYGPATADQVRTWITSGRANLETKARAAGADEWRRLGDFAEFADPAGAPPVIDTPVRDGVGSATTGLALASTGIRLGAAFLDSVFLMICTLPGSIMIALGLARQNITDLRSIQSIDWAPLARGAGVMGLGALLICLIQVWMLSTRGQTIAKRLFGIRIVRLDQSEPGFVHAVALRAIVPMAIQFVLGLIPFLGVVFWLVDIGFIFRPDRRCVHDLIAGTIVVQDGVTQRDRPSVRRT